jgi:hypothetical protein
VNLPVDRPFTHRYSTHVLKNRLCIAKYRSVITGVEKHSRRGRRPYGGSFDEKEKHSESSWRNPTDHDVRIRGGGCGREPRRHIGVRYGIRGAYASNLPVEHARWPDVHHGDLR